MSPALKKRKVSATATRPVTAPSQGIAAFGKISKSLQQAQPSKKEASIEEGSTSSRSIIGAVSGKSSSNKRRLEEVIEIAVEEAISKTSQTPLKQAQENETSVPIKTEHDNLSTPILSVLLSNSVTPRKKATLKPKAQETPTRGARTFLDAFKLASSSPASPRSSPVPSLNDTPPSSPVSIESPCIVPQEPAGLPTEVQDLICLHSAFLTALSLYYAHHGSFTPADLRELKPSIERSGGRKRIYTDDIRRILAVSKSRRDGTIHTTNNEAPCPLVLSDYGNSKICVELAEGLHDKSNQRRPLDVETLNTCFLSSITRLWKQHAPTNPSSFTFTLPLAPITPCSSLSKLSPLLSKGQRRLEDLKAGAIRAQITNKTLLQKQPLSPSSGAKAISNRTSSLLSRIRAKELHQSTLPGAPSPESLARKAALQRLEEVIPVLEILTSSGSRSAHEGGTDAGGSRKTFTFTMPTIVQNLQMSLRNPISKDEAVRCVRLLAGEVAPEWVSVREVGKVNGVTVKGSMGLGREEVLERVRKALEKG